MATVWGPITCQFSWMPYSRNSAIPVSDTFICKKYMKMLLYDILSLVLYCALLYSSESYIPSFILMTYIYLIM